MAQASFRIKKELKDVRAEEKKHDQIGAVLVDDNMMHWTGHVRGPAETCYEGGIFYVDIVIPANYPFAPPKMRFNTKLWHPNVSSQNGAICLDILKDEWSPALTMRTVLLSLQALLCTPNPDDPQDGQVAAMYKQSVALFEQHARQWTQMYAMAHKEKSELDSQHAGKVAALVEMGFPEARCREVLAACKYDEQAAVAQLLG